MDGRFGVTESDASSIAALAAQGASAGEIAVELGIEESLVRLTLRAQGAGTESDRDINDAQLAVIRKRLYNFAAFNDDPGIASKVGMFLLERDRPRGNVSSGNTITAINNAIIVANTEFEKLKTAYQ